MAVSGLIKEAKEIDVGKMLREFGPSEPPRPKGGGGKVVLDDAPDPGKLLSPPEPELVEDGTSLSRQEALEALDYANALEYDEMANIQFVKQGAPVPSTPGEALKKWYAEVNDMSPAQVLEPREVSMNTTREIRRQGERMEHWDAQDIQSMLDDRRFYPDRIFDKATADKLWEYLGDDFIANDEGNPIVLFRTGSELGQNGYPRAFSGGHEFSAHFGTRSAALHEKGGLNSQAFGGPGKQVDVYYTNITSPFALPDLGNWSSEAVLATIIKTVETPRLQRELKAVQREYEEAARVVLGQHGIDTSRSTLNEMMLEMNELNGKGLERTQSTLRAAMAKDIKATMKASGYDSLVYRNEHEGAGSLSFLPFEPTQVKNIKNVGTFNPRNENVLKSILGGTVVGTGAATQQEQQGDSGGY